MSVTQTDRVEHQKGRLIYKEEEVTRKVGQKFGNFHAILLDGKVHDFE